MICKTHAITVINPHGYVDLGGGRDFESWFADLGRRSFTEAGGCFSLARFRRGSEQVENLRTESIRPLYFRHAAESLGFPSNSSDATHAQAGARKELAEFVS